MADDTDKPNMNTIECYPELLEWVSDLEFETAELRGNDLQIGTRRFSFGWQVNEVIKNINLRILFDDDFPFSIPRFALATKKKYLVWPHVDRDGGICSQPNTIEVDSYQPIAVVKSCFEETTELLRRLDCGELQSDFLDEFQAYWLMERTRNSNLVFSCLTSNATAGKISVFFGKSFTLIGESLEGVEVWLRNRFTKHKPCRVAIDTGFLLDFPRPLMPNEYPRTVSDFLLIVKEFAPGFLTDLEQAIADQDGQLFVVFRSHTKDAPTLASLSVTQKIRCRQNFARVRSRKQSHAQINGFRDGKCPSEIRRSHFVSNGLISRLRVERCDGEWIHGSRGVDSRFEILQKQKIAIIGAGSIGSFVATNLAQAGFGEISIFDPELLTWANTGRHILGASSVMKQKAQELAEKISCDYPSIRSCKGLDKEWQEVISKPDDLLDYDLLISTTGSYRSDSLLNRLHLQIKRRLPVVYGWVEPFAAAGHAVAICANGGCFQCGLSYTGTHLMRVYDWPDMDSTLFKEGGCGTRFQPYGFTDTLQTISMICNLAIETVLNGTKVSKHSVWINRPNKFNDFFPRWSKYWRDIPEFDKRYEQVTHLNWPIRECLACR